MTKKSSDFIEIWSGPGDVRLQGKDGRYRLLNHPAVEEESRQRNVAKGDDEKFRGDEGKFCFSEKDK